MTFPLLQRLTKVQSRGRHKENFVGTRNPLEPTFWVPTWNPEPTGTHIFEIRVGSTRNPGTHGFLGSAHADPWSGGHFLPII